MYRISSLSAACSRAPVSLSTNLTATNSVQFLKKNINISKFNMEDIPAHFNDLLHKIAKEQNFVNYDLDVKPISSGGANYTCKLYIITISEGANVLNLFGKIAAIGEKMRAQMAKVYDTERYCYTQLVKLYEKIEDDNQVPDEHRVAFSKFYGCNDKLFEETIVLENLEMAGYNAYDRLKSIDWPYASSAVEQLAKMHAISFAHWKYYPDDFSKVIEDFMFDWKMEPEAMMAYAMHMVTRAIELIDEKNSDKLLRFFQDFFESFQTPEEYSAAYKSSRRIVLGHGDYKPSNLMHKHLEDGKVDIKIVDLQTLQGGSPVTDLIYFIVTGSDEEFRAKYYEKLLDHYYTELSAAMRRLNVDPEETYSREDFEFEMKEKLKFGLILAVFALPVLTVDSENAPEVNESLEISKFSVEKTSDLYAERLNGMVNDYVKWGILK